MLVYALAGATLAVIAGVATLEQRRKHRAQHDETQSEVTEKSRRSGLSLAHRLTAAFVLPVIIAFASEQAVKSANHARIGAYVAYDWSMPGFKALYQSMLSIPPRSEHRTRIPIPREVRDRAAAVSPTFASILPEMEHGDLCKPFRDAGETTTKTPGEPGSFNLWSMREAIWTIHGEQIHSAADYDAICWRIVRELRAAQDAGRLSRRWAPLAFIPPEWTGLLQEMPQSLATCWAFMSRIDFTRGEPYPVEPRAVRGFNEMGLRRGALMELHRPPREGIVDEKGPWQHRSTVAKLDAVKRAIATRWTIVSWIMLGATTLGWAFAIAIRRRTIPLAWWTMATIILASLAMRLLLAMTLEATGVAASHRYLFPSAVMLLIAGIVGLRGVAIGLGRESADLDQTQGPLRRSGSPSN